MKKKINFLPQELIKKEKKWFEGLKFYKSKFIFLILLLLIIWKLLVFGIQFRIRSVINRKAREATELNQKIVTLKTSAETELKTKQEKLNLLKEQIALKEEEIRNLKPIAELISQKEKFVYELLKTIAESIPEEVWLEEISFEREENIFFLKGVGISYTKIAVFLSVLNQFPYLKEVYLKQSEIKSEEENDLPLIHFEATGKLNL